MSFKKLYERVKILNKKEPIPLANKLLYLVEEVGEVAVSANVDDGVKKRKVKETVPQEVMDVALNCFLLASHYDWSYEDMLSYLDKKIKKWEDKLEKESL
jgi:NTP pyrophosphatase (non-canonical NTP hydrolase)